MVPLNSHHTVHSHGISPLHPIWPEFFLLTLGKPTISDGKSQIFIDFHGSQTVSNCQRDPEGISVYHGISVYLIPIFLAELPILPGKMGRKSGASGIPKHTTFSGRQVLGLPADLLALQLCVLEPRDFWRCGWFWSDPMRGRESDGVFVELSLRWCFYVLFALLIEDIEDEF